MKLFSSLCSLFLMLSSLPATAFECPRFEQPPVQVRPLITNPTYDFSRSLKQLLAMGQTEDRTRFSNTESETPVGLTAASLKFDTKYQIIATVSPMDHTVCAQIKDFKLDFGFNDVTVYVARELPNRSCIFNEILDHEHKHVRMDRKLVKLYAPKFQPMFEKLVRGIGTIRASSQKEAQQKIKYLVSHYIKGLSESLAAVRHKYQMKVDTKEEYERLGNSCNGILDQIIRNHR